jgi:DNA-binding NarL/FixJ family response regulator
VGYPTFLCCGEIVARILIADDSEVMRKQLAAVIRDHPGWIVCGEAANGVSAILKAHELKPDLVIMDLVMPMLDGLQSSAEIAKLHPTIPIVIYSMHLLPEFEVEAKKYGVWALVSKAAEQSLLIETIERLLTASPSQLPLDTSDSSAEASVSQSAEAPAGGILDSAMPAKLAADPD